MLKVVILSASKYSLYTSSVAEELIKKDIKVEAIVVKKLLNANRFISEIKKNPLRLIDKIFRKLIFRRSSNADNYDLNKLVKEKKFQSSSADDIKKLFGVPVKFCNDFHSQEVIDFISHLECDLIVFTGGGIIRNKILDLPNLGVLNCHMGILPTYRGMDCVSWAILNNDINNIGLTVHFMDEGIDTGDIINRKRIDVSGVSNFSDIEPMLEYHMPKIVVDSVVEISKKEISPLKQKLDDGKQFYIANQNIKEVAKSYFNKIKN